MVTVDRYSKKHSKRPEGNYITKYCFDSFRLSAAIAFMWKGAVFLREKSQVIRIYLEVIVALLCSCNLVVYFKIRW